MGGVFVYVFIFFLTLLAYIFLGRGKKEPEKRATLPPGSMGWPYLGETLQLYSQDPSVFFADKQKRYGEIFKTHILGCPCVMLASPEASRFVLVTEAHLFKPTYPKSKERLIGPSALFFHQGDYHTRLRKLVQGSLSLDTLRNLVKGIDVIAASTVDSWGGGHVVNTFHELKKFSFDVGILAIFGILDARYSEELNKNYCLVDNGYNSFPTNIPGTPYTSAIGSLPGRVLALTSLEVSKDMMLKYTEGLDMPEAARVGISNGAAGMFSNLVSCAYYVPLEVIGQRLMVQGLPGTTVSSGPFDTVRKVIKAEGFRGLYRGFGLTAVTQSPASALWWGAYGAAQHIIWRSLGYKDDMDKKPSHMEMVTVQATAGMVAGACSSVITTPLDTVKTRLQVMDNYGVGRPSVLKTTRTLLKEDGWRGFYRGFGPRFLNMSLYGTTMIVTYELIKRLSVRQ